ncbi:MAG TPA: MDR family MFS transporter [Ktedonobacterales bacterium]|jgi:EmrB/QacA subfamily drug resistance transporter|nr:MDR family MFS transporter [Ktedonobacterales bacterium]
MADTAENFAVSAPQSGLVRGGSAPDRGAMVSFSQGRRAPIIVGLLLGMLLAALDQTVVGTAMPHVIAELGGQNISWVYTSYLLASTVGVPIYGKLSDIYGRRIFFIGGMVVFLLGSALSGASQDMTQLIIFRGIQGLGAGALMPIAQAIIADIFPPAERGRWQGLFMAVFGFATIIGPLLGGWITDNWGWRWVFYVNMPVGAIAIITAGLTMPRIVSGRKHKIDYFGSMFLILWSVPLLLALSWGGSQYAWDSWQIIGLFAGAGVMLITFLLVELRASEPILSPRLFKNSIFTVSTVTTFLLAAGMFGAILYLPYFVQDALGQSATNSGVILTPMMLGFIVSSIIGGQLLSITGRYKIIALIGFVVATVGMFLLSRMTINTTNPELLRNMVVTGLGIGVMMSLFTIVVQNAFPARQIGEVTASLTFFRSMGSTIGLAVLGSVLTNSFASNLKTNMPAALKPYIPVDKLTSIGSTQTNPSALKAVFAQFGPQGQTLFAQLQTAIKVSFASAVTEVFLIGAGMMVAAFVVTLFLREIPLRKSNTHTVSTEGVITEGAATEESAPMELPL